MPDSYTQELRDTFAYDQKEWSPIRDEGRIDMRHVGGDPWDPKDKQARKAAGRPALALDELGQYLNQVNNEVRANKRAVKFSPMGNGANDKSAQFYADKMREIEYRSRAQVAYSTAFDNAVQRSYGFLRVHARYATSRSIAQDLYIDALPNPELVTPDPEAVMPDLSDQRRCWVREKWSYGDHDRKFTDAKIGSQRAINDLKSTYPTWFSENGVFVGEHWCIKTEKRTLLYVVQEQAQAPGSILGLRGGEPTADPVGVFEDEYDRSMGRVVGSRETDDPKVYCELTNGIEVLEKTDWPGRYIPIIGCLGKVIYVDEGGQARRKILSMVRLARDPYMLYCYYRTCEAELVGMTPKFPYFVYRGQLKADQLLALQKSLHEPVAVIEVEPTVEALLAEGGPLPFPQRQPYEPPIAALEAGAEAARRAIQAAMGQTPLPTAAQRRNEKSGVALQHIEELGQRGSFHFIDHYLDMLTHTGVVCEDLMDKVYDTARTVPVRTASDTDQAVRINDPGNADAIDVRGDHLVTVSTGPSFDSEREASSDFADNLISNPILMQAAGPQKGLQLMAQAIKLKNVGPVGDEMVKILVPEESKDGKPDPAQLMQQLQQAQAQMQQMSAGLKAAGEAIQQEKMKSAHEIELAKVDAAKDITLQRMKDATSIAVAKIQASVKVGLQQGQQQDEAIALQAEQEHERALAAADAGHEELMAQLAHQHGLDAATHQGAVTMATTPPEPAEGTESA